MELPRLRWETYSACCLALFWPEENTTNVWSSFTDSMNCRLLCLHGPLHEGEVQAYLADHHLPQLNASTTCCTFQEPPCSLSGRYQQAFHLKKSRIICMYRLTPRISRMSRLQRNSSEANCLVLSGERVWVEIPPLAWTPLPPKQLATP